MVDRRPETKLKRQIKNLVIAFSNMMLNMLPFFCVKKGFAKLIGINIGKMSYIHTPVKLFGFGRISIGRNSTINPRAYLDNRGMIVVGNNVSIAHDCKIYTAGHNIDDPYFSVTIGKVEIGDYVCLFPNCMIMPNVKIGKGAAIYPGSVVTKNVGDFEVVGGNPAKFIRKRAERLDYELDYGLWFSV